MDKPKTTTELCRFLGMANQVGKFSPNITSLSKPLRDLLSKKQTWHWTDHQDVAFQMKMELTNSPVLAPYNVNAETKVTADASAYGLGAVIAQKQSSSEWRPVAYASHSISEAEGRYSQTEKEALALVWACEKFEDYIIGKSITLEMDHKPLVLFLTKTTLSNLPP